MKDMQMQLYAEETVMVSMCSLPCTLAGVSSCGIQCACETFLVARFGPAGSPIGTALQIGSKQSKTLAERITAAM